MQCPQCGFTNADSAPNCDNCGAILSLPKDQAALLQELEIAQDAVRRLCRYIPPIVAEGILHDQGRLRGERREVAVLFVDAVDFTRLSVSLDAEPIFNLINDLMGRLMACVHRYDGVVDKLTGDGLMAVFGAPIAHESNAELAVRAALDMQKAASDFESIALAQLGAPLQVRVGVHSGPAIAGIIGTERQAAYTVIGETVNLAARLESLAQPGHILVSSQVYQQTHAFFNFYAMGAAEVKGVDQPVAVYDVVGDRSEPLRARGVAGVTAVLLGRDDELQQLSDMLAVFLDDQHGRLVMVRGEAGMGKSRLVSEALSALPGGQALVWQGRGLPYAQGVGYGIFRSLLQDALRSCPPDRSWDALVSSELRPFLQQMLGLALSSQEQAALRSLEPERVKQLTALALREWLLGEARHQPVLLVMEDFHWADDLSRDLWKSLVNLVDEAPVLICVITRPQPETPLSIDLPPAEVSLAAPLCLTLDLQPLSPQQSRLLLAHLIDLRGMPEVLIDTILTRAEGNPLYIEEFVRMLIEKEVLVLTDGRWRVASAVAFQELEIPTTLRGLMMARVDRLPEDLQQVLRTASVVGLQFSGSLLGDIERRMGRRENVLPSLERMTDLGVLVKRPEAGEDVYAFRHILNQETIYGSLLRSQRPRLHRTVAESIETLYATNLDQQIEVLALHYDRARARDKAMAFMLKAGDRACERFANNEAIEYYSRALQLSQHLSDCQAERWRAAVGLGEVQQHVGEYDEAIACYQAALDEWGEAVGDARARVMLRMGQVWANRGNLDEANRWLHKGVSLLGLDKDTFPELRAQIYSELGWFSLRRGDLAMAREQLERGLALVGETEHYNVLSSILNRLGGVHFRRGDSARAAECVERALELRERLGDIVGYARSLTNLGILKWISGDWDGAMADYERVVETYERIGEVEGLALACTNLGLLYTDRGEWRKADANFQRSFAIAQRIGHPYEMAQADMNLGRLYLFQGRWEDCTRHLKSAVSLYKEAGARGHLNLTSTYYLQGRLHLEQGQVETALDWAERNDALLREVTGAGEGESVEWGQQERLMGRIAQTQGDLIAARRHLERSAAMFEASGAQIEVGRTFYWSALLYLECGQPDKALEKFAAAHQVFEQLGAAADLALLQDQLAQLDTP